MRYLYLILLLSLTGCGTLIPTERKQQSAIETADKLSSRQTENYRRIIEGEKVQSHELPPVRIGGLGNKVELKLEHAPVPESYPAVARTPYREETSYASTGASESDSALESMTKLESTIPMGVKLILLAIGIFSFIFAIRYAIKSSAAAKAVAGAADQGFAAIVNRIRNDAMTSTNPEDMAYYNSVVSDVERERGKLKK